MRLELLHEIMQLCSCCVVVHKMVPDLFRSLHNLHPQRLQKGKPRFFAVVLLVLAVTLISVAELGVLVRILRPDLEVLGSKNQVCFFSS